MSSLGAVALSSESDMQFEEELGRDPYSVKTWWAYLRSKSEAPARERNTLHERAVLMLPRSYKLWAQYLGERRKQNAGRAPDDRRQQVLVNAYERALVQLNKMPRIWTDYCELLVSLKRVTETRRAFDRALRALPITQHHRVWELYLPWATSLGPAAAQTTTRVFRRYLQLEPSKREDFVDLLESGGRYEEAAQELALIVGDEAHVSPHGVSKHKLWLRLCKLLAERQVKSLNSEAIIRSGISKFSDEVGRLWCTLANYFTRQGQFERARDIYEEGIGQVQTVRDFGLVFDAYAQFEETVLSAEMESAANDDDGEDGDEDDEELDPVVELRLARLEHLMDRRELLLNSVLLRQNPHNVHEWHRRAKLFKEDPARCVATYAEAVKTVDPAVARPSSLWIAFAKFYESNDDLDNARTIFDMALGAPLRHPEDYAQVVIERSEMELRHDEFDAAMEVVEKGLGGKAGVSVGSRVGMGALRPNQRSPVAQRALMSVKLWNMYIDLQESLGTAEATRAAYDRMIELRIATPQVILNYATFLEEHAFHEAAFRVFERAVTDFSHPHSFIIWQEYLQRFEARYGGSKVERTRDLYEEALSGCPPDKADELFVKFARFEEQHGATRRAMALYDRATAAVSEEKRFKVYLLYLKKAEQFYGVTRTREIFERAIQELPDMEAKDMCLRFADVERKLGEVDRARAVLVHGSQFCDPNTVASYWKAWREFELEHGNENTFREMLRVRRSVATSFAQHNVLAMEALPDDDVATSDPVPAVAAAAPAVVMPATEMTGGLKRPGGGAPEVDAEGARRGAAVAVRDEDQIDIDDDMDDVQGVAVPDAVFGDAKAAAEAEAAASSSSSSSSSQASGALERFKGRR